MLPAILLGFGNSRASVPSVTEESNSEQVTPPPMYLHLSVVGNFVTVPLDSVPWDQLLLYF